ncbi:TorF family putative porin, partial [Acinetobacter baumannii]
PYLFLGGLLTGYATYSYAEMQNSDFFNVSGNVLFGTQYNFRGVSMTNRKPTVQGGINFSHKSGAYLNLWASNQNAYPESSIEAD